MWENIVNRNLMNALFRPFAAVHVLPRALTLTADAAVTPVLVVGGSVAPSTHTESSYTRYRHDQKAQTKDDTHPQWTLLLTATELAKTKIAYVLHTLLIPRPLLALGLNRPQGEPPPRHTPPIRQLRPNPHRHPRPMQPYVSLLPAC